MIALSEVKSLIEVENRMRTEMPAHSLKKTITEIGIVTYRAWNVYRRVLGFIDAFEEFDLSDAFL